MRIAICEDDFSMRDTMENIIRKYMDANKLPNKIDVFDSAEDFMPKCTEYDMVFLDIHMGGCTGMEAAKYVRQVNEKCIIVFATSDTEMVYQAFEVKAFRFLPKPITEEKLIPVLTDAIGEFKGRDKGSLVFKTTEQKTQRVSIDDIIYIETLNRGLQVVTTKGAFSVTQTMKEAEQLLIDRHFFRCHTSYIVNLAHVLGYNAFEIMVTSDKKVMLSRLKSKAFKAAFEAYLFIGR